VLGQGAKNKVLNDNIFAPKSLTSLHEPCTNEQSLAPPRVVVLKASGKKFVEKEGEIIS